MKYKPSTKELSEVNAYGENERMHYFLCRSIEAEEIWGLTNSSGWVMKEENNQAILPIWPYASLATVCAVDEWTHYVADAVSLEQFVYKMLKVMIDQNIKVEILPTRTKAGNILDAKELAAVFEGMIESGEYYMEG